MKVNKLPAAQLTLLTNSPVISFKCEADWQAHLAQLDIVKKRYIQIATEGAVLGGVLDNETLDMLAVVSDGAGQFNVLQHGLC